MNARAHTHTHLPSAGARSPSTASMAACTAAAGRPAAIMRHSRACAGDGATSRCKLAAHAAHHRAQRPGARNAATAAGRGARPAGAARPVKWARSSRKGPARRRPSASRTAGSGAAGPGPAKSSTRRSAAAAAASAPSASRPASDARWCAERMSAAAKQKRRKRGLRQVSSACAARFFESLARSNS